MPCVKNRKAEDCFFRERSRKFGVEKRSPKPQKKSLLPHGEKQKIKTKSAVVEKNHVG